MKISHEQVLVFMIVDTFQISEYICILRKNIMTSYSQVYMNVFAGKVNTYYFEKTFMSLTLGRVSSDLVICYLFQSLPYLPLISSYTVK